MTDAQQIEEPAALADAPVGRSWRYCIHIAYYGSGFVGWQRQSQEHSVGAGSVQEVVEDAVTELLGAKDRINVTSVSRTDAGTHALYVSQYSGYGMPHNYTIAELTGVYGSNTAPSDWTRSCPWTWTNSESA